LTTVLEQADEQSVTEEVVTDPVASWWSRAGALAVDMLFGLGVVATFALVALTTVPGSWPWWVAVAAAGLVILAVAANRLLLPAVIGWSLGRSLFGIAVVRRDGSPVGPWRLLARDLAHLLDTAALFIGWLWPLWDARNRTFADLLLRTEVRRVQPARGDVRRLAAAILAGAALLAAAGAGLSYLQVYRHEKAIDRARDQIHAEGPKIVEEMLTYNASSLKNDFAHAQTLTTDSYRKQLVEQQAAVDKAGGANNEYWVVSSSVLSVTPERATMLMAMQGQRAAKQQQVRFITASARVSFEKSGDGHWRVADLTVLARPSNGAGAGK
jgi:Mce-associated membrane protein